MSPRKGIGEEWTVREKVRGKSEIPISRIRSNGDVTFAGVEIDRLCADEHERLEIDGDRDQCKREESLDKWGTADVSTCSGARFDPENSGSTEIGQWRARGEVERGPVSGTPSVRGGGAETTRSAGSLSTDRGAGWDSGAAGERGGIRRHSAVEMRSLSVKRGPRNRPNLNDFSWLRWSDPTRSMTRSDL